MAFLQTQYRRADYSAEAGRIIDQQLSGSVTRALAADKTAGFGVALFATDDPSYVTTEPSDRFVGVTYRDRCISPAQGKQFVAGDIMPIARHGVVAVPVEGTVAKGAQAYATPSGAITTSETDNFPLIGARFDASGSGVVALRLNRVGE